MCQRYKDFHVDQGIYLKNSWMPWRIIKRDNIRYLESDHAIIQAPGPDELRKIIVKLKTESDQN